MSSLSSYLAFTVGLGVVLERVIEYVILWLQTMPRFQDFRSRDLAGFKETKKGLSIVLALVIGPVLTVLFPDLLGLDASTHIGVRLFMGLAAGAISPYAHVLLELLANVQQSLKPKPVDILQGAPLSPNIGLMPAPIDNMLSKSLKPGDNAVIPHDTGAQLRGNGTAS